MRANEHPPTNPATNSAIVTDYRARTQGSGALFERARKVLPSGITHDARYLDPYSIHVAKAKGPRKWDVDGNEYVDYFGGHGAMLLGHSHPAVVEAVKKQMELGTHYGSSHELEVRWAELVCELTPCAEKVRFTASGTEASHMAIRLARAYTGKDKIVRFIGHFHGWHDNVTAGAGATYDGGTTPGVPQDVSALSIVMPSDNVAAVVKLIEERDDIAAVMFEPSGASWGQAPLPPGFIKAVREATAQEGRRHADGRGDHRLSLVLGRRAEGVRRHARPLHPGQDRRRRPAGRRRRRASATSSTGSTTTPRRRRRSSASSIPVPTTPTRCRPPRR